MKYSCSHKIITLGALLILVACTILTSGCGSKEIALHDVTVKGAGSNLVISLPFDFRKPMEPREFPNGTTINSTADHDSDFEVTVNSVHYDRAKYKAFTGTEFKPDLDYFAKGMLNNFKDKFSASGGQMTDSQVAGVPAKVVVLDRTSKDIKLKMRFISFFKGDELWCVTIAYKGDDKDFHAAADKMVESMRFE